MNSRSKGKRGELMLVHALRELGFPDAARTAQHCGKGGTADLNEAAIPG